MYSAALLDHFEHPRNAGELENPDVSVEVSNPACGDVLRLTLKVRDAKIVAARFLAKGCVPVIACGSALTELVSGKTVAEGVQLQRAEVVRAVGGLPDASGHASHLAIDALRQALKQIENV